MPGSRPANPLPPLIGGILIGGQSRRMGSAKALLELRGETFVERIARSLAAVVPELFLFGSGVEVPASVAHFPVVADRPGTPGSHGPHGPHGPIAGLLAAFEHRPGAAWLILSCDQPLVTAATLAWLVAERRPGRIAVLARRSRERIEPFPGIYEPACRPALAALAESARRGSLQPLADVSGVHVAMVPVRRAGEWVGVNTPEELFELRRSGGGAGVDGKRD